MDVLVGVLVVGASALAVAVVFLRGRLRSLVGEREDAWRQLRLAHVLALAGADERATLEALADLRGAVGAEAIRFFVDGDRAPWLVAVDEAGRTVEDQRPARRDPLSVVLAEGSVAPGVQALRAGDVVVGALQVVGDDAAMATAGSPLVLDRLSGAAAALSAARESRTRASLLASDVERLDDITNATSDGVVLLNRDGRVVAWNNAMETLTWLPAADAILQRWEEVLHLERPDGDILWDPYHAARQDESAELLRLARRAEHRWVLVTASPAGGSDARAGAVLVLRDVTDQQEAESLKADFLATVSHELRTPLTPLKGFLEVINRKGPALDESHLRRAHGAMLRQVERLEALVADLLLTAELDRGIVSVNRQEVDIAVVVGRLVDGLGDAERERITLRTAGPTPAVTDVKGVTKIVQVLVSNALTHTSGGVEVEVARSGDDVAVVVRDHGDGIPEAMRAYVFERFARMGSHLTRAQGPGLGLPIADQLARLLGGEITIDSRVGRGTTFTLVVPETGSRRRDPRAEEVLDR